MPWLAGILLRRASTYSFWNLLRLFKRHLKREGLTLCQLNSMNFTLRCTNMEIPILRGDSNLPLRCFSAFKFNCWVFIIVGNCYLLFYFVIVVMLIQNYFPGRTLWNNQNVIKETKPDSAFKCTRNWFPSFSKCRRDHVIFEGLTSYSNVRF